MIDLDEQQEQVLRDLATVINRVRGPNTAMRFLRSTRWMMRAMLSVHRFFAPRSFERWNRSRIASYASEHREHRR